MYLYYILLIKLSIRDEIVNRPLPHINFTSDKTKTYGNQFYTKNTAQPSLHGIQ